jgi:hypothetical protein
MLAYDVAKSMFEGVLPSGIPFEPLGEFQTKATAKMVPLRNHVLGLPMGTGKTPIAVNTLVQAKPKSVLLMPTQRAILSWLRAMWLWHPDYLRRFVIIGKKYDKATRAQFWNDHAKRRDLHVITNWQSAARDFDVIMNSGVHFEQFVGDEYHKFMRNRDTKSHKLLKALKAERKLLVSGSPMSKGPIDMWIALNLFDHKLFSSYWKFANTWCYIDDTGHGKQVYGSRNNANFRKMLTQYAIIATKKQLGIQKKVRDIFSVEMTPPQWDAYEQIRNEMILELEDGPPMLILNSMVAWIRMRQLLCCPASLDPSLGAGGGALGIYDALADLPVEERHALIFVPFRSCIPPLKAIFEGRGARNGIPDAPDRSLGIPVFELSGGMELRDLYRTLEELKRSRGLALCTVQYAESWDCETADKCFFLGADPDPQINFQAEDRLDRITNEAGLITCYYVSHEDSHIDQRMMDLLVWKQQPVNEVYNGRTNFLKAVRGD